MGLFQCLLASISSKSLLVEDVAWIAPKYVVTLKPFFFLRSCTLKKYTLLICCVKQVVVMNHYQHSANPNIKAPNILFLFFPTRVQISEGQPCPGMVSSVLLWFPTYQARN